MNHTPGPWFLNSYERHQIRAPGEPEDKLIGYMYPGANSNAGADAAYIVQACNAYPALLTALQAHQAVGDHVEQCPACGVGAACTEFNVLAQKAIDLTKSALAQTEEAQ